MTLDPSEEARLREFLSHAKPGLTAQEQEAILARMRRAAMQSPQLRPGQLVRVIAGAFEGCSGILTELCAEARSARVELSVLGAPTVVELEFAELEPGE